MSPAEKNYRLAAQRREAERRRRVTEDQDAGRDRVGSTTANHFTPADEFGAKRIASRMRSDNDRVTGDRLNSIEDPAQRLKIRFGVRSGAAGDIKVRMSGKSVVH